MQPMRPSPQRWHSSKNFSPLSGKRDLRGFGRAFFCLFGANCADCRGGSFFHIPIPRARLGTSTAVRAARIPLRSARRPDLAEADLTLTPRHCPADSGTPQFSVRASVPNIRFPQSESGARPSNSGARPLEGQTRPKNIRAIGPPRPERHPQTIDVAPLRLMHDGPRLEGGCQGLKIRPLTVEGDRLRLAFGPRRVDLDGGRVTLGP